MTAEPTDKSGFCILVLGGSQGARSVNRAMVNTLDRLLPLKDRLAFIHQTGSQDYSWVARAYEERALNATVAPFFDHMAALYRKADVVVSRAGAITVTELLMSGKAAILVPYPHAAYNHQEMNARVIADNGAARLILDKDLDEATLESALVELYRNPHLRREMEMKARAAARPRAAEDIVNVLLKSEQ